MVNVNGSLVVVGSGIKFLSHLSFEAINYIKQSEKILYSLNEPAIEAWIKKQNPRAESLLPIEEKYELRVSRYLAITNHILENVFRPQQVCVVFYGHPTVFAQSALDAVLKVKEAGFYTKILPAISAEDCLFSDLLIDPGTHGCCSYEATDFLIRKKVCDPTSHLILWQVGLIGALGQIHHYDNQVGITLLLRHLMLFYDENHEIVIYEAPLYPHLEPRISKIRLSHLTRASLTSLSTLYIPPVCKAEINNEVLKKLNINLKDFM